MKLKGEKYLKIVGILMIICGAAAAIIYSMGFFGSGVLFAGSAIEGSTSSMEKSGVLILIFAFGLIWSILELITGVFGVINSKKAEKASICIKLGAILMILSLISSIGQMWQQGFSIFGVCSLIIGLILPAIFCYGANLNQNSVEGKDEK